MSVVDHYLMRRAPGEPVERVPPVKLTEKMAAGYVQVRDENGRPLTEAELGLSGQPDSDPG